MLSKRPIQSFADNHCTGRKHTETVGGKVWCAELGRFLLFPAIGVSNMFFFSRMTTKFGKFPY
jgi:hypothetical protein